MWEVPQMFVRDVSIFEFEWCENPQQDLADSDAEASSPRFSHVQWHCP